MNLELATSIQLLGLDVDGVMTDGSIFIDDTGNETKRFNVRDGFAIRVWQRLGFSCAIITGRSGRAVQHRAAELGIGHVVQGAPDKAKAMDELLAKLGLRPEQAAYIGDDWADLGVMRRVRLAIAPADADARVKAIAAMVTEKPGGRGAVREAIERILAAKGMIGRAVGLYDDPHA